MVTLTTPTERTTCLQGIRRAILNPPPGEIDDFPRSLLSDQCPASLCPDPEVAVGRVALTSHRIIRRDHELLKYHVWKEIPTVRTYQPKSPGRSPLRQHRQP